MSMLKHKTQYEQRKEMNGKTASKASVFFHNGTNQRLQLGERSLLFFKIDLEKTILSGV